MANELRWDPSDHPADPPLMLEPARLAVLIGATAVIAGSGIPWARELSSSYSPLGGQDSVLIIIAVGLAISFALSRSAAESRTRTIQAFPAVVAMVAVAAWLSAYQATSDLVSSPSSGGAGGLTNGAWVLDPAGPVLAGVGTCMLAVACGLLSIRAWRSNGVLEDPNDRRLTRRSVARAVVEIGCGVAGLIAGIVISINAFALPFMLLWIVISIAGGGIGLAVGQVAARRI